MADPRRRLLVYVFALTACMSLGIVLYLRRDSSGPSVTPAPPQPEQRQRPEPAPQPGKRIDISLGATGQSQQRLTRNFVHRYGFTLEPGELLHAMVDQDVVKNDAVDLVVRLYSPKGPLYEIESPTRVLRPEEIFLVADTPGIYQVEIDGAGNEGTYRIRLLSRRWASERDRLMARAEKTFYQARALALERPPRVAEAVAGFLEAERLWRGLQKPERRAEAFRRCGAVWFDNWQFKNALMYQQQALDLFRGAGDPYMEAAQLVAVGVSIKRLGDLEAAENQYRKAVQIAHKYGYSETEANALLNLGILLLQQGDSWNALEACETALKLAQKQRNEEVQELQSLLLMGRIYVTLGKFQNALSRYEEALKVLGRRQAPDERAKIFSRISELYLNSGDLRSALAYARSALGYREQAGDLRGKAVSLAGMSLILQRQGDFFQAKDLQEQALVIFHQIGDLPSEGVAHLNLGHLWLGQKDPRNALVHLELATLLARRQGLQEIETAALYESALAERLRGNSIAARRRIESTLAILGSLSSKMPEDEFNNTYMAARQKAYGFLIDLLVKTPAQYTPPRDIAASFETSEKARWQQLVNSLTPSRLRAGILKRADTGLVAKRRRLEEEIGRVEEVRRRLERNDKPTFSAKRKQDELLESLHTLDVRLRRKDIWAANASGPAPISTSEAQQLLDSDGVLLEYHLGDSRSFLWLVTPSAVEVFALPARRLIEKRARRLHELLAEGQWPANQQKAIPLARELSAILLGPVARRLGSGGIVVVPDGAIHLVPFALLPDPARRPESWKNTWPVPLLVRHRVSYLPSASVLKAIRSQLKDRRAPLGRLAVLAGPIFRDFPPLPLSRREALGILDLVPSGQKRMQAFGGQATRELAMSGKLGEYQIVHFATHAINHPEHPELSSIVLSQVDTRGRPRDGHLRLHNIHDLELPADLVVLSACKTALGKDILGEGYMSLTQGFMYAGAARVVVSLWNVNEESTPELMERFYRGLLIERRSPAEALKAAQRGMAEETAWSSPYYWAGFELHGEWR